MAVITKSQDTTEDVDLEAQARAQRAQAQEIRCGENVRAYGCGERSSVERMICEIAFACDGAMGEILRTIVRRAEEEFQSNRNDLDYWKNGYFALDEKVRELKEQRNGLLDIIDGLRGLLEDNTP